ncbi:MAG: Gfo/Idh/MocA family oxidoreductase [Halobacteriota archaeon]
MKAGVIGVGVMGEHHARVYNELEDVQLAGVSDINEEMGQKVAQKFETQFYPHFTDLLEEVDIVTIAVPTSLHKEVALKAAEIGVDMLIEKPIAESLESAEQIIRAGEENNVKIMVGHIERFNPAVVKLKEIVEQGVLGDIISIHGRRIGPHSPRIRDVGIIVDLAVHEIDIFTHIFGQRAEEVYAIAGNSFHTSEDYASILLRFPNNHSGMIETNWLSSKKMRDMDVIGSKCIAQLDLLGQKVNLIQNDGLVELEVDHIEPLKKELMQFINCIRNDVIPCPSGKDGAHVLNVAVSAIKSYMEKKVITLNGKY